MPQNEKKGLSVEIGKSDENKPKLEVEDASQISQHLNEDQMKRFLVELMNLTDRKKKAYTNSQEAKII